MDDKNHKFIYFKFLGRKQVQVSKEQWEADWKVWHKRISKKTYESLPSKSRKKDK